MADPLPLLNIYDLETDQGPVSLLCFLDPVLAGAKGIDERSVVGNYVTRGGDEFDPDAFRVNPAFVEALTGFMNEETAESEAIAGQARAIRSDWLYLVDPRDRTDPEAEPPPSNVLGAFAVDDAGQVVPGSFQYNANHRMFDREFGIGRPALRPRLLRLATRARFSAFLNHPSRDPPGWHGLVFVAMRRWPGANPTWPRRRGHATRGRTPVRVFD